MGNWIVGLMNWLIQVNTSKQVVSWTTDDLSARHLPPNLHTV